MLTRNFVFYFLFRAGPIPKGLGIQIKQTEKRKSCPTKLTRTVRLISSNRFCCDREQWSYYSLTIPTPSPALNKASSDDVKVLKTPSRCKVLRTNSTKRTLSKIFLSPVSIYWRSTIAKRRTGSLKILSLFENSRKDSFDLSLFSWFLASRLKVDCVCQAALVRSTCRFYGAYDTVPNQTPRLPLQYLQGSMWRGIWQERVISVIDVSNFPVN